MKQNIFLALKGAAMGVAEVIPGVSGGTIAFITGIYERLLNSIKSFGPSLFTAFKEGGIKSVWEHIDGNFLVFLMGGMACGVVIGVFGVSDLMIKVPEVLWAFFFGLIIASAIYIGKQVEGWSAKEIIAIILGIAVAFGITLISPAEGNHALWFVFLSGMIAISALILPGISGSFILLLMGMYTYIIPTVKSALKLDVDSLGVAFVFGLGCLTGLMSFSRVLSWTFKNYKNTTLALLTGFMIGSLNKIWPWREVTSYMNKETGERFDKLAGDFEFFDRNSEVFKVLKESNATPFSYQEVTSYEALLPYAIVAMIVGFAIVFLLEKMGGEEDERLTNVA
jgi:putative membrane protein